MNKTHQPTPTPPYPDGYYLWQYQGASPTLPIHIAGDAVEMPSATTAVELDFVTGPGMTLALLIPATPVVVEALTIYSILCGIDEQRAEATALLQLCKSVPRGEVQP